MSPMKVPVRLRLAQVETRLAARAEAQAVAQGVAETVTLSRAQGQAIAEPEPEPDARASARRGPYRRQTGLDWLAAKGRISDRARAAGEQYGQAWRRVRREVQIPCSLAIPPGGGRRAGPPLAQMWALGEATERARQRLGYLRARLSHHPDLVAVGDAVCGEEKTPREATAGERDAARVEALLKVALDLMAAGEG